MTVKTVSPLPARNPIYATPATQGGYLRPGSIGYRIVGYLAHRPKGATASEIGVTIDTVLPVSLRCVSAMLFNRGFLRVVGRSGRAPVYALNVQGRAVAS